MIIYFGSKNFILGRKQFLPGTPDTSFTSRRHETSSGSFRGRHGACQYECTRPSPVAIHNQESAVGKSHTQDNETIHDDREETNRRDGSRRPIFRAPPREPVLLANFSTIRILVGIMIVNGVWENATSCQCTTPRRKKWFLIRMNGRDPRKRSETCHLIFVECIERPAKME